MNILLGFLGGMAATVSFEAIAFVVWVVVSPKERKEDGNETSQNT